MLTTCVTVLPNNGAVLNRGSSQLIGPEAFDPNPCPLSSTGIVETMNELLPTSFEAHSIEGMTCIT
jgi:hypothetical protein